MRVGFPEGNQQTGTNMSTGSELVVIETAIKCPNRKEQSIRLAKQPIFGPTISYPLRAPSVKPVMNCFCKKSMRMIVGSAAIIAAAISGP